MPPSSAAAYQSLTAFKPRSSTDVMAESNKQYDVEGSQGRLSALKGLVGNLQSSVEAVDPSVTGRTSGTFTTEGQRQALVSKERAPILSDLSKQQGAFSNEQQNLNTSQSLAAQMASALLSDDQKTYQRLLDQYNAATAAEQAAQQKLQWEQQQAESKRQFDAQLQVSKANAGGGSSGAQVNPGQEFLNYIASQFKANGGAGNNKVSRQTQDAWANAWFAQNGVSKENRQQYWNLYNSTYKRSSDPTKDWRWAK